MVTLFVWLFGTGSMFMLFGAVAASAMGMVRRDHFWTRAFCVKLVIVLLAVVIAVVRTQALLSSHALGLPWLLMLVAALVAGPTLLFAPAPTDPGGGPPWEPPPDVPDPPRGSPRKLDDPRQRLRDHAGPRPSSRRRGSCKPEPRKPAVRPCR